jgi:hypothetical protein
VKKFGFNFKSFVPLVNNACFKTRQWFDGQESASFQQSTPVITIMEKLIESETRSSLHFTPPDSSVSGRMESAQGSPVPRSHLLHSSRVNIYLQLHATLWRRRLLRQSLVC